MFAAVGALSIATIGVARHVIQADRPQTEDVFNPTAEEVARIIHTPSRGGG